MSTSELGKLIEISGQLGIARQNALSFAETISKLATTTDISSNEAALRIAQLANVTNLDPSNYERLGSVIAGLGDATATTADMITKMSQRIAASASIVGFSERDILAISAAVGSLGIESEAGGSAVDNVTS